MLLSQKFRVNHKFLMKKRLLRNEKFHLSSKKFVSTNLVKYPPQSKRDGISGGINFFYTPRIFVNKGYQNSTCLLYFWPQTISTQFMMPKILKNAGKYPGGFVQGASFKRYWHLDIYNSLPFNTQAISEKRLKYRKSRTP